MTNHFSSRCGKARRLTQIRRGEGPAVRLATAFLLLVQLACTSLPRRSPDWNHPGPFAYSIPADEAKADPIPSAYQAYALRQGNAHRLQLLETGEDALLARIHLIRAAERKLDLQSYIWRQDSVTRVLWDELMAAADRGVRVRILIDAFPPMGEAPLLAQKAFAHEGIELRLFNPPFPEASVRNFRQLGTLVFRFRRLNQRMHHKVMLVDDRIALIGGRNLEDKYFDRRDDFVYKDRDVLVMGPVVADVRDSFETFWVHRRSVPLSLFKDVRAARERVETIPRPLATEADREAMAEPAQSFNLEDLSRHHPRLRFWDTDGEVRFLTDSPLRFTQRRYRPKQNEIRAMIREAESELIFQSPYLIYDGQFRRDLGRLRRRRPGLSTIFSTNSLAAADHPFVYAISFKHRKLLYERMRLDIYQLKPDPAHRAELVPRIGREPDFSPRVGLHAKSLVVDRKTALVSTHNFDPRSAYINSECGLLVRDEAFARHLAGLILRDTAPENSWVVGQRKDRAPFLRRVSDALAYSFMVLPVPDIWPHSFTSIFRLREGMEPVPPRHPDFHAHYEDVGLFPGLDDKAVQRQVQFIRAMGGWSRPLL